MLHNKIIFLCIHFLKFTSLKFPLIKKQRKGNIFSSASLVYFDLIFEWEEADTDFFP